MSFVPTIIYSRRPGDPRRWADPNDPNSHNSNKFLLCISVNKIMKLHKYKIIDPNDHAVDMVKNGNLWFCNLGDLNDPFEGDYAVSDSELSEISKCDEFSKDGNDLICRTSRYIDIDRDGLRRQFYILSLTEKADDILMWSHYADQHKGIVIEYDIPDKKHHLLKDGDFNFIENEAISIIHKVDYSGDPVYYSVSTDKEVEYGKVITRKTKQWSYESEYRIIIHDVDKRSDGILLKSGPKIVTAVYFGMRVTRIDIDKFINRVSRKDVKYYKMAMRHGHFQLITIEA